MEYLPCAEDLFALWQESHLFLSLIYGRECVSGIDKLLLTSHFVSQFPPDITLAGAYALRRNLQRNSY